MEAAVYFNSKSNRVLSQRFELIIDRYLEIRLACHPPTLSNALRRTLAS